MSDFYWSMNEGTFACLHDKKRTTAFRRAIKNSTKKGDVVVDAGSGSGILSMFAADAGASRVYAIELDRGNIASLNRVISENGYSDVISVIQGDAITTNLPENVDLILCEMIATGLIEELQVPAMNNMLRFLKPSGRVLLEEYHIYLELVYSKSNFHSKTFNIIRFECREMRDMRSEPFSSKIVFKKVNFLKYNADVRISETILFRATADGVVNALRLSGKTFFSDKSTFANSTSYDFPTILPIDPISVKKGGSVSVRIAYEMCNGPNTLLYHIIQ